MLIPEDWRKRVCFILQGRDPKATVLVTKRATLDWDATFPEAFPTALKDTLVSILRQPLEGELVLGMTPPGVVYEFMFKFDERLMYGKVGLHDNDTLVIVFSAHVPLKGNEL